MHRVLLNLQHSTLVTPNASRQPLEQMQLLSCRTYSTPKDSALTGLRYPLKPLPLLDLQNSSRACLTLELHFTKSMERYPTVTASAMP